MEFQEFPKMARLSRECIISEKIDGTNAQIVIEKAENIVDWSGSAATPWIAKVGEFGIAAGSRTRYITPNADNFGFARWVLDHSHELVKLGCGRHFGEWWGSGIQRNYGLTEKRFSLFNTTRWVQHDQEPQPIPSFDARIVKMQERAPACCHLVPVLYQGLFGPKHAENMIERLKHEGSMAAPGFMKPEGVVVYHIASGVGFKKTIDGDDMPKSKANAA